MIKSILVIGFLFIFIILNTQLFETYDEKGYDNKIFLHCSDSTKLHRRDPFTGEEITGYGFNNNYYISESDITYQGGKGDFSTFLDVYKIRREPPALQAPICMQKTNFSNPLHIPSFFRDIYQAGDSNEILEVEEKYESHIYDPFYEYRSPENIRDTLVLDDTTNDRVIKQHDGGKDDEFSGKEFNLEPKSFRKTCLHHDALGNPFPCGNRTFNSENAYQECEDNSLSERSCDNICCENPQESFIIN
jgi:hypothetical protein